MNDIFIGLLLCNLGVLLIASTQLPNLNFKNKGKEVKQFNQLMSYLLTFGLTEQEAMDLILDMKTEKKREVVKEINRSLKKKQKI